jgi:hypothetical protein
MIKSQAVEGIKSVGDDSAVQMTAFGVSIVQGAGSSIENVGDSDTSMEDTQNDQIARGDPAADESQTPVPLKDDLSLNGAPAAPSKSAAQLHRRFRGTLVQPDRPLRTCR